MKPSSGKKKGRRLVVELRDAILKAFPQLSVEDIVIQPPCVGGDDLKLSPAARALFPFSVEGKNQERIQIWAALKQCQQNAQGRPPCLVFSRNHMPEPWAAIPLGTLLHLLRRLSHAEGRTDS